VDAPCSCPVALKPGQVAVRIGIMLRLSGTLCFVVALSLTVYARSAGSQEKLGSFHGDLIVKALSDGRKLQLTHPFAYRDPKGRLWPVPSSTIVDGASIPQTFWSIIGGPFSDKYRDASVIHDYYCERKSRPWRDVHLVFYNAMRARGVPTSKAKIMYAAVYNFGPRWVPLQFPSEQPKQLVSGTPILLDDAKDAILKFVAEKDPSIEEIEQFSQKLSEIENPDQLEKLLYEHASCTPILFNLYSDVVKNTVILCGMSKADRQQTARKNLERLLYQLIALAGVQAIYLMPALEEYTYSNPETEEIVFKDPERWQKVIEHSRSVLTLVKLAVRSTLDVEDTADPRVKEHADTVFTLLSERSVMLTAIVTTGPPETKPNLVAWIRKYRDLVDRLKVEIAALQKLMMASPGPSSPRKKL
jgi:hypothetical protein